MVLLQHFRVFTGPRLASFLLGVGCWCFEGSALWGGDLSMASSVMLKSPRTKSGLVRRRRRLSAVRRAQKATCLDKLSFVIGCVDIHF